MVDDMTRIFSVLSIMLYSIAVSAADMPDPTRPPAFLLLGADENLIAEQKPIEPSSTGLQSTIISATRRAAIIDGKTVEMGAMHGDARLIEVNEGNVVLQNGQARRVLSLFPGVNMTQSEIKVKQNMPKNGLEPAEVGTKKTVMSKKNLSVHPKEKK